MFAARDGRVARWIRTLVVAFAALCTAVVLGGCSNSEEAARETLARGIEADMASLSSLTTESARSIFDSDFTDQLEAAGIDPASVYGPLFANLTYTVDGIDVAEDEATISLTITNLDLAAVFEAYTDAVTDELMTDEGRQSLASLDDNGLLVHLMDVLVQCATSGEIGTVTTSVDLTYTKEGSRWQASDPTALTTALLGGLDVSGLASEAQAEASAAETAQDTSDAADASATQEGTTDAAAGDASGEVPAEGDAAGQPA